MVEVTGSHYVDVTAATKDGKLMINLINTSGPHDNENVYVFDNIPPVGPLSVAIRTAKRPKKVTLQPENIKLDYTFSKGQIKLMLPKLEIHNIIVVEP